MQLTLLVTDHGHAATTSANHHCPGVNQVADQAGFNHSLRGGATHHAAEVLAVGLNYPAALAGNALGGFLVINLTHELGGVSKGGVSREHQGLAHHGGHLAPGQGVLHGLQQPVTDHALGFSAQRV